MANILRTIVLRSSFGGLGGGGTLQSPFGSQKLLSVVPNLLLNSLIKCSSGKSFDGKPATFEDFKSTVYPTFKKISQFGQINFDEVYQSGMKEGILLNTFQKICKICERNKHRRNFKNEVKQFVHSKNFMDFCTALDKKLPTLSPGSLIALTELENFRVQPTSSLMQKLFRLILDNFNRFNLFEVVYLYVKFTQTEFSSDTNWKNIKKACEVFFRERFELDLLNCNFSPELLSILELEAIPESLRKSVAKKLMEDAYLNACNQKEMTWLLRSLCNTGHTLIPKEELLRLIKKCSYTFHSHSLILSLSTSYTALLHNDDSFYDEEIISLLINAGFKKLSSPPSKIKFIHNMSLVGYYNSEFVSFVCNFLQTRSARSVDGEVAMTIANILARYSFHETEPDEDVRMIRKLLSAVDNSKSNLSFPQLCSWCEFLTYLGCETRDLCSEIFTEVMESPSPVSEKNMLTLHHLAKAYYNSCGYQILPYELLKVLLADEFKQVQSFSVESLAPYLGGEDYVLKNCTTSEKHCLHFVSLLGADNKPINLSDYKKKQLELPVSQFLEIEEIQRPPGSKMVVFQIFPERRPIKFLNDPRLTGIAKMHLKVLENLDCSVVFLPQKFFQFAAEAKTEFLRTQINEVVETAESPKSTVVKQ